MPRTEYETLETSELNSPAMVSGVHSISLFKLILWFGVRSFTLSAGYYIKVFTNQID